MLKPLELAAQEIVDAVSELTESTASSPLLDPKSDIYSKMIESKMECKALSEGNCKFGWLGQWPAGSATLFNCRSVTGRKVERLWCHGRRHRARHQAQLHPPVRLNCLGKRAGAVTNCPLLSAGPLVQIRPGPCWVRVRR